MLLLDDQPLLQVQGSMLYEENGVCGRFRIISHSELVCNCNGGSEPCHIPSHYLESVHITVPQVLLNGSAEYLGAQILTRTLEVLDDVLRNHCPDLSEHGVYSSSDLLHIIPCPLCAGDRDERGEEKEEEEEEEEREEEEEEEWSSYVM